MNNDANTKKPYAALLPGNREVLTDLFANGSVMNEPQLYAFKVYVRLNAMKQTRFQNVSFRHSVFDAAYFNRCL